jgi:hypothetical protein
MYAWQEKFRVEVMMTGGKAAIRSFLAPPSSGTLTTR